MRRTLLATIAAASLVALAPVMQAQVAQAQTAQAQTAPAARGVQIDANHLRAKDLIDRDIYTTDNVEIGEIEDLLIDPAEGRVTTVVVEVENRLGLTDKYVAVPLNQLRMTPGQRSVTIDMTRDQVRSLRGIDYRG